MVTEILISTGARSLQRHDDIQDIHNVAKGVEGQGLPSSLNGKPPPPILSPYNSAATVSLLAPPPHHSGTETCIRFSSARRTRKPAEMESYTLHYKSREVGGGHSTNKRIKKKGRNLLPTNFFGFYWNVSTIRCWTAHIFLRSASVFTQPRLDSSLKQHNKNSNTK